MKKIFYQDKIFIAGSGGMVGKSVFKKLLESGYGNKDSGGEILTPSRKDLNLVDQKKVNDWFEINKPNIVILAAAKVGGILANSSYPFDFISENLKIQNNVIESAWKNGVRRFLFLGSSCIYPKFAKQPIKEEYLLQGGLETTNEPYAIAKIAGIKLCEYLNIQYGFDAISLMPTNLYGPNDNYHSENSHVVAALIKKFSYAKKQSLPFITIWGSGEPLREFMHVDDLGDAVVFALENWLPKSENSPRSAKNEPLYFLNVGTGKDIKIIELANIISKSLNYEGEIIWDRNKPDGTPKKQLDISRIKKLGWAPKIDLIKGISETAKAYYSSI